MERGDVDKAGDLEECASSSAVAPKNLTCMPSHSSGSEAASSTFYSACSEGSEAASSVFYSTRIEGLRELRSKIDNQLEFDVESSRSHWTEVSAASDGSDDEQVSNKVAFESMKEHPHWGPLFCSQLLDQLEIGARIAEGGQAEIYEAFGRDKDDAENRKRRLVLKVFKKGYSLVDLQRLWPLEIGSDRVLHSELPRTRSYLCWPVGVHLLDDGRFAFIFHRFTSDLRKLIDKLKLRNGGPPFYYADTNSTIIQIALGMRWLHTLGILHNDLKASNVLVEYSKKYTFSQVVVADFESSKGIVGTGFWRAPEILLAVKDGNMRREILTEQTDVYSFGMTCYEVITGRMPFEDHDVHDYDIVLRGERPTLPDDFPCSYYNDLVRKCWHQDPAQRPSFKEILEELAHLVRPPMTLKKFEELLERARQRQKLYVQIQSDASNIPLQGQQSYLEKKWLEEPLKK